MPPFLADKATSPIASWEISLSLEVQYMYGTESVTAVISTKKSNVTMLL